MKKAITTVSLLLVLVFSSSARATLIDRGNGLIYDTVLNITWVQDGNLCVTLNNCVNSTRGIMTWADANTWAASLVYGGFSDWRLPITVQPDPTCVGQEFIIGFPAQGFGFNCTGSEMGYMFYRNLGGTAGGNLTDNQGPFTNIEPSYWSDTEVAPDPSLAWSFLFDVFDGGDQAVGNKGFALFAWAVRDGDVVRVPEPGSLVFMGVGLLGLRLARWRRQKTTVRFLLDQNGCHQSEDLT